MPEVRNGQKSCLRTVTLRGSEIDLIMKALSQIQRINTGNFNSIVYEHEWDGITEDSAYEAVEYLDQVHKILLNRPATITRLGISTKLGKDLADLSEKFSTL